MTEMMIRMHKQELDKAIANGNLEEAQWQLENMMYFMKEYKEKTGKDFELQETSKEVIESLTRMDREAAEFERLVD